MDKLDFLMLLGELEGKAQGLLQVALKLFNGREVSDEIYQVIDSLKRARYRAVELM
jgi:hypothetical protein